MGILLELLRKKFVFVIYPIVGTTKLKTCQGTQTLPESKEGRVARERKGPLAYHCFGTSGSGRAWRGLAVTGILSNTLYFT